MAANVILIEATPRRAADGVAQTVRLAGGGALYPYRYGGNDWRAGVVQLPTFVTSITFEGGDFGAGGVPSAAELQWAASTKPDLHAVADLYWIDAPVTVRIGPENDTGALPPIALSGKALSGLVDGGVLKIAMSDPAADLKKPLLTDRYGGTGDLDGPAEWEGKIKPRVWGRVWNRAGECIDKAHNIWCWADPLRPIQAFDAVRDKGAPAAELTIVSWQGTAAATLAALRAAAVPPGGGVVCPSLACVRWWTQPAGDLTADLRGEIGTGYVETTADIVARIVAAGPGTAFAAGTVATARAARPAPVGWVAADDSTTVAAMIEELLGNSSLLWLLNDTGEIVLREWAWGAPAAYGVSQSVKRTATYRPVSTRKLGYRRNEKVMARGDLAAIVLATDATYLDGTPIETLKPAQPGATEGAPAGTPVSGVEANALLAYVQSLAIDTSTAEGLMTGAIEDIDRLVNVARVGSGEVLIGNSTFDEWPLGSGTLPTGWEDWHNGALNSRVAGKEGLYAFRQTTPNTLTLMGLQRWVDAIEPGFYEIDATFELVSGSLAGAVIYVDAFKIDPDTGANVFVEAVTAFDGGDYQPYAKLSEAKDSVGATIGAGTPGRLYRMRHLLKVIDPDVTRLRLYVQTNSEYFGPNANKTMVWHRAAIKATDGTGILALDTRAVVTVQSGAIAGLQGRTQAFWQVQGFAGEDAEVLIYANASSEPGGGSTSQAGMIAKEIWLAHPDIAYGYQRVFGVVGGNVYVLGKLIADSVYTNNLVNNAAVVPVAALLASPVGGSGGSSLAGRVFVTVHLPEPGTIRAICTMAQQFTSGTTSRPWNCQLRVDNVLIPGAVSGGTVPGDSVTIHGTASGLAAGDHEISLWWDAHSTVNLAAAVLTGEGFPKTS